MGHEVTIGGDRLGAGKKEKVYLHGYERSTHDLSYVWKSTMAAGTLVPFINEVALPGDTFDINLDVDVKTHPTIGPLFGSYKVQLDIFQAPVRLYQGKLHMNMLGIGLKMQDIKLPVFTIGADKSMGFGDNSQINPSSIFKYLGISGIGSFTSESEKRDFNAVPYLSVFDIYKQYYANKQEGIGYIIHNPQNLNNNSIYNFQVYDSLNGYNTLYSFDPQNPNANPVDWIASANANFVISFNTNDEPDLTEFGVHYESPYQANLSFNKLTEIFDNISWNEFTQQLVCNNVNAQFLAQNGNVGNITLLGYFYNGGTIYPDNNIPRLHQFDLDNIDMMRKWLLSQVNVNAPLNILDSGLKPYILPFQMGDSGLRSQISTQEGLLVKTYQSDLFNNWISTEWIDGPNGINEITAIDTSSGSFSIDTLQLSRKVYDMLNRIAISGGTYDDWLDAVYTHERTRSVENPIYHGGLSKELAFQEVISNAGSTSGGTEQPLGTLAGRGVLTSKHKGGQVTIKVDEPSYIIGFVSLTPRLVFSQGNDWHINIKTMDDYHKPAMDEIGFQSLITELMLWQDTTLVGGNVVYKEAGKQPAWINYMTKVDKCYGNFAIESQQMWMTLNRRYEGKTNPMGTISIKDLTTYIDPTKFNHIFADTRLDAQNFWVNIGVDMKARRKMSAKVMPNL